MIAVIDYGVGNLYSVEKALTAVGAEVSVTSRAEDLTSSEKIVLPGVGAFGDCMKNLEKTGLIPTILEQIKNKKPLLGICVGLQILFEGSDESPGVDGLKIFRGRVKKISAEGLKIPHMGWNKLEDFENAGIFAGLPEEVYFYFVHSYHAFPADKKIIAATTRYGEKITAGIQSGNIFATQFHPEKSGDVGLKILKNFVEL